MSEFAQIANRSARPTACAVVLALAWIASCDGSISPAEYDVLSGLAKASGVELSLAALVRIAAGGTSSELEPGLRLLRALPADQKPALLKYAVGVSLEDGYLTAAESHILRFLADLLGEGTAGLNRIFRELTESDFPAPTDPSSVEWWRAREQRASSADRGARESGGSQSGPHQPESLQRLRDLAVLGLDESAGFDEIRAAFRRMSQVHHPDRYAAVGEHAVAAAVASFARIRAAYERLTAHERPV